MFKIDINMNGVYTFYVGGMMKII